MSMNLTPQDRADLLAGIGKLAREREADKGFDSFVQWLERKVRSGRLCSPRHPKHFEPSSIESNSII
jgi:hypothetical protein